MTYNIKNTEDMDYNNSSRRFRQWGSSARESHLIDKAMTLEPHGLNRRDELL